MVKILAQRLKQRRFESTVFLALATFSFAIILSLWGPWSAQAAVTETSLSDRTVTTGVNKVKPGGTISVLKFNLSASAGEYLTSSTFKIVDVSNASTTDFNSNPSLMFGYSVILFNDLNNNGVLDMGPAPDGDGGPIGLLAGSALNIGATSTLDIDSDSQTGGNQPALVTTTPYILAFVISTSSAEGHSFRVSMSPGTATYNVTSTAITSAGILSGVITIDNTAPTSTGSLPTSGSTFAPPDTLVQTTYSESMAPTTSYGASIFSTTNVMLKALAGNTQGGSPTGSNLCSAVPLTNNNATVGCTHTALATSTWYMFAVATTTMDVAGNTQTAFASTTFRTGSFSADNNVTPPFILSTLPSAGIQDFPTNGKIIVEFPHSTQGSMAIIGAGSVTSTSNVLLQTVTSGAPSGTSLCVSPGCTFTWVGNNANILAVVPGSNLTANTNYALTIKNTVKNSAGIGLGGPDFLVFFKTGSGTDTSGPGLASMSPASSTTNISLNTSDIVLKFSEGLAPNTISYATTSIFLFADANANGALDNGEAIPSGDVKLSYDSAQKIVHIGRKALLAQNTKYCVQMNTGVTDTIGNAAAAAAVGCFTTANVSYTATSPTVSFADADNFKIWVQYDQPVDPTSATTASNYTVESPVGTQLNLTNATFNYRSEAKGVEITGIGMVTGQAYKVTVTGVKDLSGNATIVANGTTNIAQGSVQNSATTGGLVGGADKPDFNQTNFATFWQNPQRCAPNSTIAGKSSRVTCEFPTSASLTTGAKIVLTFPTGFSVASSSLILASSSPMNADLNGGGPGVTTITAMATNTNANTVTLTLAHTGTAMGSSDQLRFEVDGVVNPSTAGSYSVSIITKDSSGVKQGQTITTAPFSIGAGGSLAISGKVCKGTVSNGACGGGDTAISGAKVFLDSPGSGHQEAASAGDGTYSFTSLSAGQYNIGLFIDPTVASGLGGGSNFQNVNVTNASVTGVDFKKADVSSSGKTLTVSITGGPASTDMDVFCFAPGNVQFSAPIMKQVTTNGSGAASATLKVQPSTNYQCGLGPHIPFDSFSSGAAPTMPTFSFVPPPPQTVVIGLVDTSVSFALTLTSQSIIGKVTDGSGTAIASVFVNARPISCFDTTTGAIKDCFGSSAQTKSDGTYTLNVTAGTYQVSACAPGLPCTSPVEVTVKTNSSNSDNNTAADVYSGGTLVTSASGVIIKMSKSSITISGQVLDESSNAMKYAFVQAKKVGSSDTCTSFTPSGGDTGSPTDSSGNYTLYVTNGTWRVEAFAGTYGQVNCSIITISSDTSKSSQNIQATASSYGTINGTVTKAGTAVQGAQVNCFGSAGGNQTVSGSDGTFSIKVKAGTYRCDGFLPGAGQLTPATGVVVAGSGTATAALTIGNPATITVALGSTVTDAFCDARDSSGMGGGTNQNSSGTYTLNVPVGTYTVRCGNPKIGEIGSQSVTVTAGGTQTVTFTPPTLFTVTGSITDGSANLEGASITLTDKTNGRSIFKQSDATSSGTNVSISIPAGTYSVQAAKAGYVDSASPQTLVVSANTTFTTRSLTKATASASLTVQLSGSNYTGDARVVATRSSDGKVVVGDMDETITSGANVSLPLTSGTWSVVATGDNGKQSSASTIVVSGSSADSTPTLSLANSITGFSATQTQQPVVPSSGGLFKDTNIGSNFEVNIPSGALSTSDATAGTIETKTNPTLAISTPGKTFLGTAAIDVTPKNSLGSKLSELASAATIKIPYSEADIPSGVSESQLQCGTWNDATGEWETLSTTVDTTNNVLTCATSHFSTFGAIAATSGGTVSSNSDSNSNSNSSSGGGGGALVPVTLPTVSNGATTWAKINDGASVSNSRNVTLKFSVDNADQVAISNDPNFKGASFQPFASSIDWQLTSGNGKKIVYVRFRSKTGGVSNSTITVNLSGTTKEPDKQVTPVKPVVENKPTTTPVTQPVGQFTKDLKSGSSGAEVMALQIKLQTLGFLDKKIVVNGNFGPATMKALKAFQKANKLSQTGSVGSQTRTVLNGSTTVVVPIVEVKPAAPVVTGQFTKDLKSGSSGAEVMALQIKLQTLGFLDKKIVVNGNFGPATMKALKAFQKANKVSQTGSVGSQTRAALNR